jgi:EmrB/QacA subfamily drug resistance transporter
MSLGLSKVAADIPAQRSRTRLVYAVLGAAVFMTNLDVWIVNVALDAIGKDLPGSSLSGLSWVLNAYAVTLAALLIVAGRTGDRVGARRLFFAGIAIFTIASLGCAVAPDLGVLVAARVAQGIGAALQIPTSLALLLASVTPERRHHATRLWIAVGALAAAAGPVLGGLLVEASWRWIFVINLPIGIATLVIGARVLPAAPSRPAQPLPDLFGSLLLTASVAALTGAIVQGPGWGWSSPAVLGLSIGAAAALAWFGWRCAHHPRPLIELGLLRVRTFALANTATFGFSVAFAIMLLSNALWCEGVWGYSALRTGLAMAPGPLVVPAATIASARMVRRYGAGRVSAVGCLLFAAGMLWRVLFAGATPDYLSDMLPAMILGGAGVGLGMSTLMASGTTALPHERAGTGAALVNTTRQVAASVGVAVLVAILGGTSARGMGIGGYQAAWLTAAGLSGACAVIALLIRRAAPQVVPQVD